MKPWSTIDRFASPEGEVELRRRGDDWLIVVANRVLMTSAARRSEEALATLALRPDMTDVLVAGLGMGYTLRAALDALGPRARVVVRELHAKIVDWCRGPLAEANGRAALDPRVTVEIGDVKEAIPRRWDAILLDLYEGPYSDDGIFGTEALKTTRAALKPGGSFAIWSEDPDESFERRLVAAGFRFVRHRAGKGGRAHVVWVATSSTT